MNKSKNKTGIIMKKLLILLLLSFSFFACQDVAELTAPEGGHGGKLLNKDYCGIPKIVTLFAGQTIDVGTITIGNDADFLYVTYTTTGSWYLDQTHLYVGSFEGAPTSNGNPIPGQFPYKTDPHSPRVQEFTYTIPLAELLSSCFIVASHAAVVKLDEGGNVIQSETAWGAGDNFPGRNWATYSTYCIQDCTPTPGCDIKPGDFRTQTQGGWGAPPKGNNPGTYLKRNFASAFPSGITIGTGFTLKLTSASAIEVFLPQGGTPAVLTSSYVNPVDLNNVFTGQVLALALNIRFDLWDVNFGRSATNLKDLKIAYGPFENWTVQQLLDEAYIALGGGYTLYSISMLNNAVSSINENFVDGTFAGTFLTCP